MCPPPESAHPAPSSSSQSDTVTISIKAPGDSKLSLSISLAQTVLELKKLISEITDPRIEPENQRLIYSGRVLKDETTLSEYKIQSGHSVHMVKGAPRPSSHPPPTQQIPANLNAGQQIAGNPLAPLLNATNQIPGFNPFADMGINPNDPNMAMNMMNNPQVLQSAARLLEDPAVVEQMIASDPRLQAMGPQVREMLRSPMFRQMLTNPDLMRSMSGMAGPNMFGGLGSNPAGADSGADPVAAALGANPPAANPTNQPPGVNGVSPLPGLGAMDPMAFMNSPLGQLAMNSMQASGGGGMLGGLGLPLNPVQPTDPRAPEERYEVQLGQLQAMGFSDARQNVRALLASGGNVEAAIEYILSGN